MKLFMKSDRQLKIVLALSAFSDSIGGPVGYAVGLKKRLESAGVLVKIVCYDKLDKYPKGARRLLFLCRLFRFALGSNIVYGFNLASSGLPACLASWFLRKKLVIRLGGDFLWERAVEKGKIKETLQGYYRLKKSNQERFWLFVQKQILKRAHKIIFTTDFQKELYQRVFRLKLDRAVIIENPFPRVDNESSNNNFQILYAGRLVRVKNIDMLKNAVSQVKKQTTQSLTLKIIGENPMSHQELLQEISNSWLCVLPSLSEISPNFALECIALRKPILLTKENGLNKAINEKLLLIDPKNQRDLERKILYLLDDENYQNYLSKIKQIDTSYSWQEVAEKHILLFNGLN